LHLRNGIIDHFGRLVVPRNLQFQVFHWVDILLQILELLFKEAGPVDAVIQHSARQFVLDIVRICHFATQGL
jgi:hypothetical protein